MQQLKLTLSEQQPRQPPPSLRPYQVEVIDEIRTAVASGAKRVLVYLPCGAGKTIIAAELARRTVAKGRRILFLVHLDALVNQTSEKMHSFDLETGFIKAGYEENPYAPVQIGSIQTMGRRKWWHDHRFDVIVIDECLAGDSMVQTSAGVYRIDDPEIVGKFALSWSEERKTWEYKRVTRQFRQGVKKVYEVAAGGKAIRCTGNHLIMTDQGWKKAEALEVGDLIASPALELSQPSTLSDHPSSTSFQPVESIRPAGETLTWDIEVNQYHNFVANGLLVHNCHQLSWYRETQRVLDLNPGAVSIGLTATPFRLSKRQGMADHFAALVKGPMPSEILEQGFLSPLRYFTLPEADLKGVRKTRGDYDESQLSVVCNRPELIQSILLEWFNRCPGKRTIAFCVDGQHARDLAAAYREQGVNAVAVLGDTNHRKEIYRQFSDGTIQVLTSCDVISIGFDEPSAEVGLMLRPTQSLALHLQQIGRIQRISPSTGKEFGLILDQAGNVRRHGPIELLRPEDITLTKGRKIDFTFDAVMKTCPRDKGGCGHVMLAFHKHCPECGYVFPVKDWIQQTGELEEFKIDASSIHRQYFVECLKDCYRKGHSPARAQLQFQQRFRQYPQSAHTRHALFDTPSDTSVSDYFKFLCRVAFKRDKDLRFVKSWMTKEFGAAWSAVITQPELAYNQLRIAHVGLSVV